MKTEETLCGPFYCDSDGEFVGIEDAAHPDYDPKITFFVKPDILTGLAKHDIYVYDMGNETYYRKEKETIVVIKKSDIPGWMIEKLFKREPNICEHNKIGDFAKYVFPLIRKSYPRLVSQNLISIQPMTGPVGGI